MPLEDTMQAQIFDGIQSIKSRETKFLLPRKTGPLTETSMYIKPPRKYGLHAIVVRFSVKLTERITLMYMYVGFIMHTELQHCSIYCQKLTNTEHNFFYQKLKGFSSVFNLGKIQYIYMCQSCMSVVVREIFCIQFLKVLKLISPIEIIFIIPHSSLSIHVKRVIDEIF